MCLQIVNCRDCLPVQCTYSGIVSTIERELRAPLSQLLLTHLDPLPLASATIAQVCVGGWVPECNTLCVVFYPYSEAKEAGAWS